MIEQSSKMNLKNLINHVPLKPSRAIIPIDTKTMNTNKNFDSLLSSASNLPNLVLGSLAFIFDLVSLPVYTTIPRMYPAEAKTVFYHKVFSRDRGSLLAL
jgi:hypothetical protein